MRNDFHFDPYLKLQFNFKLWFLTKLVLLYEIYTVVTLIQRKIKYLKNHQIYFTVGVVYSGTKLFDTLCPSLYGYPSISRAAQIKERLSQNLDW